MGIDFASTAILCAQVVDALTTPTVGYFSDRTETKIGKRLPWYIFGSILTFFTLPGNFVALDLIWKGAPNGFVWFYYLFFPCLSNVGYAAIQISHFSLCPSLTCSRKRRDKLNSLRNSFTFTAYIMVLLISFLLFKLISDSKKCFMILILITLGIGICTTFFFFFTVKEKTLTEEC